MHLRLVECVLYSAVELVEEAGYGGEDGGLEGSQIVLDEQNVSSEEADGCTTEEGHDLQRWSTSKVSQRGGSAREGGRLRERGGPEHSARTCEREVGS